MVIGSCGIHASYLVIDASPIVVRCLRPIVDRVGVVAPTVLAERGVQKLHPINVVVRCWV